MGGRPSVWNGDVHASVREDTLDHADSSPDSWQAESIIGPGVDLDASEVPHVGHTARAGLHHQVDALVLDYLHLVPERCEFDEEFVITAFCVLVDCVLGSLIAEFVPLLEEFELLGKGVVWQGEKCVLNGCKAAGDVVRGVHAETVSHLIVVPERTTLVEITGALAIQCPKTYPGVRMAIEPVFPPGLTMRGATPEDLPVLTALLRSSEEFDAGEGIVTVEDIESEWMLPGFDPSHDTLLVSENGDAVAYAEVPGWRVEATVHPDTRGRGIGTALLVWIEGRAIERTPPGDEIRVGQTVIDTNTDAISLFVRRGYSKRHTSWVLRLPRGVEIEHPPLPDGVSIRPFVPEREERQVYQVVEDAFNEWPTRTPSTFEEWRSSVTLRPDFDPTLLLVAVTESGVIGVSFGIDYEEEGWVQQLAVQADHRGRGIGRALLRASFDDFRLRGSPEVGLSTDSRTGALDLYLDIGMILRSSYTHYSKVLQPN